MVSLRFAEQDFRKGLIRELGAAKLHLTEIRESAAKFDARRCTNRFDELSQRWCRETASESIEKDTYFQLAGTERALNAVLTDEYEEMLEIAVKQQWKTDAMRVQAEEARMQGESMASAMVAMEKKLQQVTAKEKRTGRLLRDLQSVFMGYVRKRDRQAAIKKVATFSCKRRSQAKTIASRTRAPS